jgi:DNA-binding XRE family transcriptional regulator
LSQSDIELGREVVRSGKLQELRSQLGLSRNAMAELLHTAALTYTSWEKRPETNLWPSTAEKVGRFYRVATEEILLMTQAGLKVNELMPFHLVATQLGLPQETLFGMYRDGLIEAVDGGILGLWVEREQLERYRAGVWT